MPHHHSINTTEHYSSESTDSYTSSNSNDFKHEELSTTAHVSNSQNNAAMFQTVNNNNTQMVDQSKDKESCCDCLLSLFFKN